MVDLYALAIRGASDDCVLVNGYINEEFYALNEPALLMITAPGGACVAVEAEWCPQGLLRAFCEGWRITVTSYVAVQASSLANDAGVYPCDSTGLLLSWHLLGCMVGTSHARVLHAAGWELEEVSRVA